MTVLSLHELTIVHNTTGERRTLAVYQIYPREVALRWPLRESLRFHNRNGKGIGKASQWTIEPVSLRALHKKVGIYEVTMGPSADDESGQKEIK